MRDIAVLERLEGDARFAKVMSPSNMPSATLGGTSWLRQGGNSDCRSNSPGPARPYVRNH